MFIVLRYNLYTVLFRHPSGRSPQTVPKYPPGEVNILIRNSRAGFVGFIILQVARYLYCYSCKQRGKIFPVKLQRNKGRTAVQFTRHPVFFIFCLMYLPGICVLSRSGFCYFFTALMLLQSLMYSFLPTFFTALIIT